MEKEHEKMRNASGQQFFVNIYDIFSIKGVTRKFHGATTTANKCTKKGAASAKSWFFAVLVADAV